MEIHVWFLFLMIGLVDIACVLTLAGIIKELGFEYGEWIITTVLSTLVIILIMIVNYPVLFGVIKTLKEANP